MSELWRQWIIILYKLRLCVKQLLFWCVHLSVSRFRISCKHYTVSGEYISAYLWLLFAFWDAHVAIQGHPLLTSEMCTLGSASSAVCEPQNHNFHVSRSLNRCSSKPTPVYFNSP